MPKFDLSQAADFSRLTQGTLGDITSLLSPLLGGRDPREWDILEAQFNGIYFHIFESKVGWDGGLENVVDRGGRRKVPYVFPYRDGRTTDDLGAKPHTFEMNVIIHGPKYLDGYRALISEFNKSTPGILVHPVRGEINCVVEDFQITHQWDSRKAILLNVIFGEHNFTIGDIRDLQDSSIKAALAAALEVFAIIDTAINAIEGAQLLLRGIKNRINDFLNVYKSNSGKTLSTMNQTFNSRGGSADIPSLLPVNRGGTRATDGSVIEENFVVVRSVSDPFNSVPVEDLSPETIVAVAVLQIEKDVQDRRDEIANIIQEIQDNGASLELFDTIIELRKTATLMQDVLEKGIASSNATISDFTVPILMSIREVAYANGISVDRVEEIDLLNPDLLSVNFIPKGTVVKVPVS